jgi:hypothetical protein
MTLNYQSAVIQKRHAPCPLPNTGIKAKAVGFSNHRLISNLKGGRILKPGIRKPKA